ncbi:hypothetical protein L596_015953 [Steinernema carpocapsae]|uniref:tRNA (guanine(9)-N(1))-methyltransferase n=1 Tax=Steinernema carpocapsae TaxID=34508 RepID=A0A4U5NHR0_STECR|nr:hypothetical protein L596_015953 [Steinernema carpocapsae]
MSKKQMKKLKRREAYLEHRKEKRVIEKERKKAKRQAMKEAGIDVRKKPCYAMASSNCKQTIAIDMGFSDYMNAKDIAGTVNQLAYSYSANRHTENPAQFSIVNFTGTCREHFDKSETTKNWDVNITEKGLKEALPDHKIVYLTADSDNVVTELDESCVYVIGGLIDHNAHKGLTLRLAEENGFEHARLPLSEHVTLQTRKVLTINHVFEILLHYTWSKDWRQAFLSVIPERKGIAANDGEKKDVEAKEDRAEDEGEPEKEEN